MQETPVHIKLWHKDFWLLLLAELLLTTTVYVFIPVMPQWLLETENFSPFEVGLSMGAFAVGLYLLGAHCSYLVQRYRRNKVCMWSILLLAVDIALLHYLDSLRSEFVGFWVVMLHRLVLGAMFGMAQMVLSSTLIIDTCESHNRTLANYSIAWFSRFALALGPVVGILVFHRLGFANVVWIAMVCALLSVLFIHHVSFPFRAPEDGVMVASLDRFLLPQGYVLFVNLVMIGTVVGLVVAIPLKPLFFVMMMGGFFLAILAQHFVFKEAELKSEVISGLILVLAALLIMVVYPQSLSAPVLMGLGVGIVGSRFLLFFIKLSHHCQRGTSQSTYFLAWESGLMLGVALAYATMYGHRDIMLYVAIGLTIVSLLVYHLFTHSWFLRHKNR